MQIRRGGCRQVELGHQVITVLCRGIGSNCTLSVGGPGRLPSEEMVGIGEAQG